MTTWSNAHGSGRLWSAVADTRQGFEDSLSHAVLCLPRYTFIGQRPVRNNWQSLFVQAMISARSEADLVCEKFFASHSALFGFYGFCYCCVMFAAFRIDEGTSFFLFLLL